MTAVGTNIKKRREDLGMTQEELAKKLKYKSKSTINKIEMGINDITQSKVVAFAKALGTTPSFLMGWEDETVKVIKNKIHDFNNSKEKKMISELEFSLVQLNESGLEKVSEYVSDLLDNNKYKKNTTIEEPDHLKVKAAQNDNAADPEQQRLMRQDLQDMEDNW